MIVEALLRNLGPLAFVSFGFLQALVRTLPIIPLSHVHRPPHGSPRSERTWRSMEQRCCGHGQLVAKARLLRRCAFVRRLLEAREIELHKSTQHPACLMEEESSRKAQDHPLSSSHELLLAAARVENPLARPACNALQALFAIPICNAKSLAIAIAIRFTQGCI